MSFDFNNYYSTKKLIVDEKSINLIQPTNNNLYEQLVNEVPVLVRKVEQLDIIKFDPLFKNYLYENLHKNECGYKHTAVWYLTEDGKNSFKYASPELIKSMWIYYKQTKLWIEQIEEDGIQSFN
jgi:hypothetical protein